MTAPEHVAQVAEVLALHGACAAKPGDRDRMTCGMLRPERHGATDLDVSHQAEVLAAAGLIPTSTEWGVRGQRGHTIETLDGRRMDEEDARDIAGAIGIVVSRAVTDWKDAS